MEGREMKWYWINFYSASLVGTATLKGAWWKRAETNQKNKPQKWHTLRESMQISMKIKMQTHELQLRRPESEPPSHTHPHQLSTYHHCWLCWRWWCPPCCLPVPSTWCQATGRALHPAPRALEPCLWHSPASGAGPADPHSAPVPGHLEKVASKYNYM